MEIITRKKGGNTYNLALKNFSEQFKDIAEMKCIYINSDNKVYAAEWIDTRGVFNFNSGYAPDAVKQIKFI